MHLCVMLERLVAYFLSTAVRRKLRYVKYRKFIYHPSDYQLLKIAPYNFILAVATRNKARLIDYTVVSFKSCSVNSCVVL